MGFLIQCIIFLLVVCLLFLAVKNIPGVPSWVPSVFWVIVLVFAAAYLWDHQGAITSGLE